MPWIVGQWTDRAFFLSTVNLVFGSLGDKVPREFIEDRTRLRGVRFDIKTMTAALPHHRAQVRAHLDFIEAQVKDGARNWLLSEFSLADVSAYMNLWYVRSNLAEAADALLAGFPATRDWEQRCVRSVTAGVPTSRPVTRSTSLRAASLPRLRRAIQRTPAAARLVTRPPCSPTNPSRPRSLVKSCHCPSSRSRSARQDPQVGEVVVHFPRAGYVVAAR